MDSTFSMENPFNFGQKLTRAMSSNNFKQIRSQLELVHNISKGIAGPS